MTPYNETTSDLEDLSVEAIRKVGFGRRVQFFSRGAIVPTLGEA